MTLRPWEAMLPRRKDGAAASAPRAVASMAAAAGGRERAGADRKAGGHSREQARRGVVAGEASLRREQDRRGIYGGRGVAAPKVGGSPEEGGLPVGE